MNSFLKKIIDFFTKTQRGPLMEDPKPEWMERQINSSSKNTIPLIIGFSFMIILSIFLSC